MFNDGNLVLAVAALGGLVTTLGLTVYALTDAAPQEKPRIERRAIKKAA